MVSFNADPAEYPDRRRARRRLQAPGVGVMTGRPFDVGTRVEAVGPTAEQVVTGMLINHIDDPFGSIRKTVGR